MSQGIVALPRVSVYKPGEGRLVTIDVPVSRVKHLKLNLDVLLRNPGMAYTLDPNGFVQPTGKRELMVRGAELPAYLGGYSSAGLQAGIFPPSYLHPEHTEKHPPYLLPVPGVNAPPDPASPGFHRPRARIDFEPPCFPY